MKLRPCGHNDVCLSCLRRTALAKCPICRTPVAQVVRLATGELVRLPIGKPTNLRDRSPTRSTNSILAHSVHTLQSRGSHIALLSPAFRPLPYRPHSLTQMSPNAHPPVARQASPSVRSVPASDVAAFAHLRRTGSTLSATNSRPASPCGSTRESDAHVDPPATSARTSSSSLSDSIESLILLGPNRKMLVKFAQRLVTAFPPPQRHVSDDAEINDYQSRNIIFLDGQLLKIFIMEAPPFSMRLQLANRIERLFPRLILLCADFHNVASFEVAVRLDMDVLDYMSTPIVWVLLRTQAMNVPFPFSAFVRKRPSAHYIEEVDVRVAKHFITSPRPVVAITIDGRRPSSTVRKLIIQAMAPCSKTRASKHPRRRTSVLPNNGASNPNASGQVNSDEANRSLMPRANSLTSIAKLITGPRRKVRTSLRPSQQLSYCFREPAFHENEHAVMSS